LLSPHPNISTKMDSHPPSPTSQPSSPRSETSHQYSEVPTEPLPPSELRVFNEHMTRRKHFLSDFERYNPVQNMHALANHVFDLSENVHRVGDEVATSRRMLDIVGSNQREGNHNLRIIGEDVIGLEKRFGILEKEIGQLRGRVEETHRETQQGFAEIKGMLMALVGGAGGLRV